MLSSLFMGTLLLQKEKPHKYISRTMGPNGKWQYDYGNDVVSHGADENASSRDQAWHHQDQAKMHQEKVDSHQRHLDRWEPEGQAPSYLTPIEESQAKRDAHQAAVDHHTAEAQPHQEAWQQERQANIDALAARRAARSQMTPHERNMEQGRIYGWD